MNLQPAPVIRVFIALLVITSLSACERTRFASAPADATGCDRELVGHWLNEKTEDGPMGEVEVTVNGDCSLQIIENDKTPSRVSSGARLRSARVANDDLLWIDAAWADAAFELDADAITPAADVDAQDVYLYRWRRDGDQLILTAPNAKALAHAVIDEHSKGELLQREYERHVRITESQAGLQSLLARDLVFKAGRELRFMRHVEAP